MPKQSLNLRAATRPSSLEEKLEAIASPLRCADADNVRARFTLPLQSRLLKTTLSLCDVCLEHVPAAVFVLEGRVYSNSICDAHGLREALLENDQHFYRLSNKDRWGRIYDDDAVVDFPAFKGCCGGSSKTKPVAPDSWPHEFTNQQRNKTCTVLVEITDACNLTCRVCYADAKGDRVLPFDKFKHHLTRLVDDKGTIDSVQLTGGEAVIHPQFWDILHWLYENPGVSKIYLPTNGIEFSKPEAAKRLRPYRDKLLVLLQFDGAEIATNQALRAANPLNPRMRLIKALDRNRIAMQLTMTLAHGVSEREIAWVVRQGIKHKHIRLIGMLPAFFSGRYELAADPMRRLTLSDVIKGVAAALPSHVKTSDFLTIPCSHPNCGWTTLFARRFGLFFNIARHVNLRMAMDEVAYKTILSKPEIQDIIGTSYPRGWRKVVVRLARKLIRPRDVFGIAIKPFMDRYNYDQDRVSACCHHTLDTEGHLVSFCEYNATMRAQDSWSKFPTLKSTRTRQEVRLV